MDPAVLEKLTRQPVRFNRDDAQAAGDTWRFNCGPAALCAVLHMTPEEIRPHLLDFEQKGYTNPSLMASILRRLRVPFKRVAEWTGAVVVRPVWYPWFFPGCGLVRIQWGGPWTQPGVPIRVRYRHTHWVGARVNVRLPHGDPSFREMFDINAICAGGWLPYAEWADQLIPWLIRECQPEASGEWWPTHIWEVERPGGHGGGLGIADSGLQIGDWSANHAD
jgi:hypothetical protein